MLQTIYSVCIPNLFVFEEEKKWLLYYYPKFFELMSSQFICASVGIIINILFFYLYSSHAKRSTIYIILHVNLQIDFRIPRLLRTTFTRHCCSFFVMAPVSSGLQRDCLVQMRLVTW